MASNVLYVVSKRASQTTKFTAGESYREASSWDGVGRMASLTLQKLQICVRTKAIFKLEIKGKELDSW